MYHFKLCRAILLGFRDQLRADGTYTDGFVGLMESGQERGALTVLPVQIAPEIVDDTVYELKDKNDSIMSVQIGSEVPFCPRLRGARVHRHR